MFVMALMTVLCTAGVAFYLRFLSASLAPLVIGSVCDSVLARTQ
jgi:hypothetical protein